ncbi:ADP-ribosylation factor family protein [Histomonas meleagridis]|uniref:ADP-ribosylation factor family protein n=1 Tax=Histomonas meleagridis TaxID=135588 RepID=UPI0035599AEF|nr:ADP-ribosylation factor family protein [Histomonas meleagridis]KAH0801866.1 ADP-ribosylation factor family protein [Histomonas meleagridis]
MSITIVGLSNAGKTTLIKALIGESTEETVPTIGVEQTNFTKGGVEISAWDIGGHKQFQFLWGSYCQNSNAILYVLDAADDAAIEESATKISELVSNKAIDSIPILICGNKIDLPEALNADQLISRLRLPEIEGHDIALFTISAKEQTNLDSVVKWLIDHA